MDDMIKSITDAEEKAAEMKNEAAAKAAALGDEARAKALETEASAALERAKYREENMNAARYEAEERYKISLAKSKADAKEAVAKTEKDLDLIAGEIAGRIRSGNC